MSWRKIKRTITAEPGTYILILEAKEVQKVKVGKLGYFDIEKGYYAYVGSAFGSGGVHSRVRRHNKKYKKLYWHIDYLRKETELIEIWYAYGRERYEHKWAQLLESLESSSIPFAGFGSSDCDCPAHLFYFENILDFNDFYKKLKENLANQKVIELSKLEL
ncbi:Uri superfamily endonuclease [Orenia metallireducens]|uniref:Uri superfamily endonuclease n=1 Tax=Orenia metallireducens TaxID=1413210 RepID=A0A285I8I5_9FIRM|nr:GIY-YIG nuclease family protein [Orenia metallireducens]SNY43261.1 Uri superfamily endonuclease [Orenia metallireducens]